MLFSGNEGREAGQALGEYGSLGFTLVAGIALFSYAGWLVDQRFGTAPTAVAVGCLLGAGGGLYRLIKRVTADAAEADRRERQA